MAVREAVRNGLATYSFTDVSENRIAKDVSRRNPYERS